MFRARFGLLVPPSPNRGRGDAGRPMRPIAACAEVVVEGTRVSQVTPANTRHSPRNGLQLMARSPRRSAFLSPSPPRSLLPGSLTPASRRQDHTLLPSASGAVRQKRLCVHRIPPRVRDDREPPLSVGRDGVEYRSDLGLASRTISENRKLLHSYPVQSPSGQFENALRSGGRWSDC
jgi:hypothetical protein